MKTFNKTTLLLALIAGASFAITSKSAETKSAAGYWEGSIELPTTALAIRVELKNPATTNWTGAIDIPVQGVHDFALTNVVVKDSKVEFVMPGIPGNPEFEGTLDNDAISGNFSQGGQKLAFQLHRRASKPIRTNLTPDRGIPGKGLAGAWQGSLRVNVSELRLVLKLSETPGAKGPWTGSLASLDQDANYMPAHTISISDRKVHLEWDNIGGRFEGTLNDDGSEIVGRWSQAGQDWPLVFKRLEKAPKIAAP